MLFTVVVPTSRRRAVVAMGLVLQHAHAQPAPPSARTEQPIPAALDDRSRPGSCRIGWPKVKSAGVWSQEQR
jgi:hypothetical protein